MRHIALFSQTGSEIAGLIRNGFIPDKIFYDQRDQTYLFRYQILNLKAYQLAKN